MDERARLLLKTLVERYIADGQPVGSRTLSQTSGLELSPATIRNVMSDLEALGLIASPHTSAGRIPTARGYRLFVDTMLTAQSENAHSTNANDAMQGQTLHGDQPQKVIANAASLLSNLSHFVGVVVAPKRSSSIKHMEFLRLSERRLLLIMVTPDGDVQNRILLTEADYTPEQLQEATNYLNAHYSGLGIEQVRSRLQQEAETLRSELATLMQAAVQAGSDSLAQDSNSLVVVGEKNLLTVSDLATDIHRLRSTFELFEQKTQLLRLLEQSTRADGVHIYIGGESQIVPIEQLSVVSSPYTVNGQIVGTLGVIGPTRMPYERMIKIVDITARLVGNALSQQGG